MPEQPPKPGRWNEARWKFQMMQGHASSGDLALQRNQPTLAKEELARIRRRLEELDNEIESGLHG